MLLAGGLALALLVSWDSRPGWLIPSGLGLVVFGLYLSTLLPSVGTADTLEFQVVVARLQVAHPTGYPLYILMTHPFTWIPVGSVAWRGNFASAVYAVAAVVILYDLAKHLTGRPLVALLALVATWALVESMTSAP